MSKTIVTSGQPFTDIDAFACAIAYTELLTLEGENADAVLPGPLNASITEQIKSWKLKYSTQTNETDANYVLVDISERKFFARFVDINKIAEIYDHRYGFEDYWKKRLGAKSHIDMVGSCATLIWEEYVERRYSDKISTNSANLLYTAIVSNTLNFKAYVTTDRDRIAFDKLSTHVRLPKNWIKMYFASHDDEVSRDIYNAIINDTKDVSPIIAQLELWDSKRIILNNIDKIESAIKSFNKPEWFLTSPSISEGINYIFTKSPEIKVSLKKLIDADFDGDIGKTKRLWLRKEMLKLLKLKH